MMWPAEPAGGWHRAVRRRAAQTNGGHGAGDRTAQNPAYRLAFTFFFSSMHA
jgi:hypothetical protein